MQPGKLERSAFVCTLFILGIVGCRESDRSKANAERNAQRQADLDGTAQPANSSPSFFPAVSTKLVLLPGKIEIVQAASAGPMTLKIVVNAKQNVAFGVVPRADTGNFTSPAQVSSAMEKLKCANSGTGNLSLTCELTASDKDMVIVVADMRDSAKAKIDAFDPKKREEAGNYGNEVSVDLFVAIPPKR